MPPQSDKKNFLDHVMLTPSGYAWTFAFVVLVYAYQAVVPSLNSDDVIQIQSVSQDARTFLAQGRWGYFIVFEWLQDNNPGGLFHTAVGNGLLLLSSWFAYKLIGFRHGVAIYAFLIVSSVSIYYGMLFDFSSTRLAYPLANAFALGGLYAWMKGRYGIGMFAMALAPALYPAASQVAGMALVCFAMAGLLREPGYAVLRRFVWGAGALVFSLILYFIVTVVGYRFIGIETSGRMNVSALAIVENFDIVKALLLQHSIPFLSGKSASFYITLRWIIPLGIMFIVFIATAMYLCLKQRERLKSFVVLGFIVASFMTPFALAFAGSNTPFPPRSLIALALLHGFWVAFVLDTLMRIEWSPKLKKMGLGVMMVSAVAFVFDSASQINQFAYDKHLSTQSDLMATNRLIQRIENVAASTDTFLNRPQPIVVIYDTPLPASPRGDAGTARHSPWSREWIFRLIDPRFQPANAEQQRKARKAAEGREGWPHQESVFFHEGIAVVIVNQVEQ